MNALLTLQLHKTLRLLSITILYACVTMANTAYADCVIGDISDSDGGWTRTTTCTPSNDGFACCWTTIGRSGIRSDATCLGVYTDPSCTIVKP